MRYQELVKAAKAAGASPWALEELGKYTRLKDALQNEHAPDWAYFCAQHIIKGRFKAAEGVIAKKAMCAYCYARDIIKDRWPEAEEVIAKDKIWAPLYARDVYPGRNA